MEYLAAIGVFAVIGVISAVVSDILGFTWSKIKEESKKKE